MASVVVEGDVEFDRAFRAVRRRPTVSRAPIVAARFSIASRPVAPGPRLRGQAAPVVADGDAEACRRGAAKAIWIEVASAWRSALVSASPAIR